MGGRSYAAGRLSPPRRGVFTLDRSSTSEADLVEQCLAHYVELMKLLEGKVAIVTGANTGIGKATARGLATLGAKVILACRDLAKAEVARAEIADKSKNGAVEVMHLDLADTRSIRDFATAFPQKSARLDILVNNAGVFQRRRATTVQGFEMTFGVNHLGTFLLTRQLLPILEASKPSRIVVLSSKLHYRGHMEWDDLQLERNPFSGSAAYNQSKLANVLFTKALSRRLGDEGVTVNAVHPGVVTTELTRDYPKLLVKVFQLFTISPEAGAKTSLHVAIAPELATTTGAYFERSEEKPASKAALDEAAQERLWSISEALLGENQVRAA
jgi:NAD(P)-dependent dehydrogenase (short-subunit alcohol dehydrogenase family)